MVSKCRAPTAWGLVIPRKALTKPDLAVSSGMCGSRAAGRAGARTVGQRGMQRRDRTAGTIEKHAPFLHPFVPYAYQQSRDFHCEKEGRKCLSKTPPF